MAGWGLPTLLDFIFIDLKGKQAMKKHVILLILLSAISMATMAAKFPSEDELDGVIKSCSIGISKQIQASASTSLKSWRNAAVEGKASYSELGAILSQAEDGTISSENYKTYTSCIINLVNVFNIVTLENCENPIYKVGRGPVCGVELYRAMASSKCDVLEYNTNTGAQCGADQYYRCQTGACGWNRCAFIEKCYANECRHHNCGVERYKTCKHEDFGVKEYKTCRHEDHGVETYKPCRNEEFGFERCG